jgi:hypothetical protein
MKIKGPGRRFDGIIRHILTKLDIPTSPNHNRRVHAVLTYLRS